MNFISLLNFQSILRWALKYRYLKNKKARWFTFNDDEDNDDIDDDDNADKIACLPSFAYNYYITF